MTTPDVVVVDHHDSYTGNLVHLIASVTGALPRVVQHDEADVADVLAASHIVLSPGPGHPTNPSDFRIGSEVLRAATQPVLGVCLGMQGMVTTYGGRVDPLPPAHGIVSQVHHDGSGLFADVPQAFDAVRYHSLAAMEVPADLVVTARADDHATGVVMAVRHRERPQAGVQFHPESILSRHGARLISNFLSEQP